MRNVFTMFGNLINIYCIMKVYCLRKLRTTYYKMFGYKVLLNKLQGFIVKPPFKHDKACFRLVLGSGVPCSLDCRKCHPVGISSGVSSNMAIDNPGPPIINDGEIQRSYPCLSR